MTLDFPELVARYIEYCIKKEHGGIVGYYPDCYYGNDGFRREEFKEAFKSWLEKEGEIK